MAIRITGAAMALETGNRVVATAQFGEHASADAMARGWPRLPLPRPAFQPRAGDYRPGGRRARGERLPGQPSVRGRAPREIPVTDRAYQAHHGAVAVLAGVAAVKQVQSGAD